MVARHDAIADFRYDPQSGRYRWRSGTGKGQFASTEVVLSRTRAYVDEQKQELINTGRRLSNGQIDLEQFQRQAAEHVKQIHLAQATLGKGGIHRMQGEDWLRVGRELKRHYYSGIGEEGKRFGLQHLADDIRMGRVSKAQLLNRLGMYGDAGKVSYWDAWKSDRTGRWGRRVLGSSKPCSFCIEQAGMDARLIEDIPPCGCCPQCLSRCKCSIVETEAPRLGRGDGDLLSRGFGWVG